MRLPYAGDVASTAEQGNRTADRLRFPKAMRRDVRMLGDILGQVIGRIRRRRISLADVEDLRRRVIAAREHDGDTAAEAGDAADDEITALVASWPVATGRNRSPRLYRLLSPGQPGRRTPAGPHPAGTGHRRRAGRESLGAAVASLAGPFTPGPLTPGPRDSLLARLEVHPVLTAHPTEARRRAVTEALRRISAQLARLDNVSLGADRPGRGPPQAARGNRPALADLAAADPGDAAAG